MINELVPLYLGNSYAQSWWSQNWNRWDDSFANEDGWPTRVDAKIRSSDDLVLAKSLLAGKPLQFTRAGEVRRVDSVGCPFHWARTAREDLVEAFQT